mmetsp:Transcript_5265/g.14937  ORF Transcript_5265/g.14937 Transcript_5265/m.14937 type:complete len:447 (-) Transcript_5265:3930-5270(-)
MAGTKSKKRKAAETGTGSSDEATGAQNSRHRPGVLSRDLLKGLQDPDKFCDITLVGSDEGRVPAIRSILAMRSPVLERMLLGSFQEAQSEEIRLDFSSRVLRSVVEWCVSDTVESFVEFQAMQKGSVEDEDGLTSFSREQEKEIIATLQTLVEVAACAHYLELKSLQDWLEVMLENMILREYFAFALTVWDSALKYGAGIDTICAFALEIVRQYHRACLGLERDTHGGFLRALSEEGLQALVKDATLAPYALDLFDAVEKWSKAGDRLGREARMEAARVCASEIDLLWIPPKKLARSVRSSGLVEDEKVIDAIAEHAKYDGPCCVCVFGAGITCINGIYRRADYEVNDAPVYEMEGNFQRRKVTFGICRDEDEVWYISLPEKGNRRLSEYAEDVDFYCASQREDTDGLSENMKWFKVCNNESDVEEAVNKDVLPAPELLVAPTWGT